MLFRSRGSSTTKSLPVGEGGMAAFTLGVSGIFVSMEDNSFRAWLTRHELSEQITGADAKELAAQFYDV